MAFQNSIELVSEVKQEFGMCLAPKAPNLAKPVIDDWIHPLLTNRNTGRAPEKKIKELQKNTEKSSRAGSSAL
jgi:hypothetical protein